MFGVKKEKLYPVSGVIAAFLISPLVEILLFNKTFLKSYSVFVIILGGVVGAIFLLTFSILQNIFNKDYKIILQDSIISILLGFTGGAFGFFSGQFILGVVSNQLSNYNFIIRIIILTFAGGISWGIIGGVIGLSEGIKDKSLKSSLISALGGLIGGLIGGMIVMILVNYLNSTLLRITVFVLLGFFIGLFINIVKSYVSSLELVVLNGSLFQRKFLVTSGNYKVGRSHKNSLVLNDYVKVSREHAFIKKEGNNFFVNDLNSTNGTFVNDVQIKEKKLSNQDIIKFGDMKVLVNLKSSKAS